MQTFRDISEEALFFRRTQITKYTHVYSITLQIAQPLGDAGGVVNLEPILQIMEDADFHITHMIGSITDPVNSVGTRENYYTGIPAAYPMAGSPNRQDRGVFFKFIDPEVNRHLQIGQPSDNAVIKAAQLLSPYDQTMLSFNDVFSPGHGYSWGKPVRFNYTLTKSNRLKIQLQNRQWFDDDDDNTVHYTRLSMGFIGNRYTTVKG